VDCERELSQTLIVHVKVYLAAKCPWSGHFQGTLNYLGATGQDRERNGALRTEAAILVSADAKANYLDRVACGVTDREGHDRGRATGIHPNFTIGIINNDASAVDLAQVVSTGSN